MEKFKTKANLIFKNKISVTVFFSILQEHIPIQDEPEQKWNSLLRRMLQESQENSKSSSPQGNVYLVPELDLPRKDIHYYKVIMLKILFCSNIHYKP